MRFVWQATLPNAIYLSFRAMHQEWAVALVRWRPLVGSWVVAAV